jgi:hypothetical protein
MSGNTSKSADIPRYLRYKADVQKEKGSLGVLGKPEKKWWLTRSYFRLSICTERDYREAELCRANRILHDRVVRMRRGRLCTGCASFDWERTLFYTSNIGTDKPLKPRWHLPSLDGTQDDDQ